MIDTELPPYMARLDDTQRAAALDTDGPVVIFAGAGAGKSAVLAARVAHLIDNGIPLSNILCLTFTNKAADEMRDRIESYSRSDTSSMCIGTYHSVCAGILREYGSAIGIDYDFTIYDDSQSHFIVRLATKDAGLFTDGKRLQELQVMLDKFKAQTLGLDDWCDLVAERHGQDQADEFRKLYSCYSDRLRSRNALDFGDLTREVHRLLESSPDVLYALSGIYRYILVDEYQDTSVTESQILRLLSSCHGNLCVVGDVRQAIFSWRGSDYRLMLNFEKHYSGAKVHVLLNNYRSARAIVEASEKLIAHASAGVEYRSLAKRSVEGGVEIVRSSSDDVEADVIARFVEEAVSEGVAKYGDIAVLSRIRSATKTLEETLERRGLPFTVAGESNHLLLSPEVRCALAYLRLVIDPLNVEARSQLTWFRDGGISEVDIDRSIKHFAGMHACGVTLHSLVKSISKHVCAALEIAPRSSAARSLYQLGLMTSNYNTGPSIRTLQTFLNELAGPNDVTANAIQIMTIHQSKGLEFPVVFVIGMEEEILPCWHAIGDPDAIEEERRLFYVAMTRAKEWLCLCHSENCQLRSGRRGFGKSRFINEACPTLLQNAQ